LFLPIIAYTLSSTKLDNGKIVSASYQEGRVERDRAGGVREVVGEAGRNDPNIVCTYE
jgi:hypothetical protein